MKGKEILLLIILVMITALTACSRETARLSSSSEPADTSQVLQDNTSATDALTAEDLSISFFEWDVRESIIDNALGYRLNLRNGSPYPILSTEITYKTKDTATDEELTLFDDFKKSHKKYISQEEDNRNIILTGQSASCIRPGRYLQNLPITIGVRSMTWYDTPNYDQFILMQPDTLSLGLVKNNRIYHCHYDFLNKTWTVDKKTDTLNNWPDTRLAEMIPEPDCSYYQVTTKDDDDFFGFTAFEISKDTYRSYVSAVKEEGFTKEPDSSSHYYSAEDRKRNSVDITYDEETQTMIVHVNL